MDYKEFNRILYEIDTTYSGYARVRGLLEHGQLGEYEDLDSLVMAYTEARKEMERVTMQLCEEFVTK